MNEDIDPELVAALRAFSTSAMNGIILLAARMKAEGLMDSQHIHDFHDSLSLPLVQPNLAENRFVAPMQEFIDVRFASLLEPDQP